MNEKKQNRLRLAQEQLDRLGSESFTPDEVRIVLDEIRVDFETLVKRLERKAGIRRGPSSEDQRSL